MILVCGSIMETSEL